MERQTANVPQPDRKPAEPAAPLPAHPLSQIRRALGNQAFGQAIQAMLKVSQPGDQYEQEADRVADQVMRMADPGIPAVAQPAGPPQISRLQRGCAQCEKEEQIQRQSIDEEMEEEEALPLQAKRAAGQTPQVTPARQSQIDGLHGGGQPLPGPVRAFFEPRFGRDFSHVSIHTDAAADIAKSINAKAFTVGRNIVFGAGQYQPESHEGQRLLAHELTHVAQQQPLIQRKVEAPQVPAPAEQKGASRPADPGVGEGIDLTFILTSAPGDEPPQKDFIEGMTSYIKNVLRADNVDEVKGLEEMFDVLNGKYGDKKVRRIRIVGHGFDKAHGGEVLTRDLETKTRKGMKSTLVTPTQVREFAKLPENRDTITRVMLPGAVVEFWGCNLGNYPEASKAWADLFQSTFVATTEKVAARFFYFPPKGPIERHARSSKEVDRAGPRATKEFDEFLLRTYKWLVDAGEIAEVSDDPQAIVAHMRDMFDRSSGEIGFIAVQEAKGQRRYITPDKSKAWNAAWVTFPPMPIEALADENAQAPAEDKPAPAPVSQQPPVGSEAASPGATPPSEAHEPPPSPEPPAPEPQPAAEPPAPEPPIVKPPAAEPPAPTPDEAEFQPAPPVTLDEPTPSPTAPLVKPPTLEEPTEAEAPPSTAKAEEPAPAPVSLVGPQPDRKPPSPIKLERQWEAEHREGGVTQLGSDHLILWNFGVNSTELKPEHAAALDAFARHAQIALLADYVRLRIDGHASRSGIARQNVDLAIGRASAAFNRLVDRGFPGDRCDLDWHSSGAPWFPNVTGGARARNRRVELRLVGLTTTPSPPAPRQEPEPPKHRRTPSRPEPELKLGEMLPGASVEFKKDFDPKYPFAITPYVVFYPSVEISGKYKLKTERNANFALQFKDESDAKIQFKTKLNELIELKVDSAGNFGFGFKGDILNSEFIWDWKKLKEQGAPVVIGIWHTWSSPDLEYPPGSGVHWLIEFEIKGKFALGLSKYALAELGLTSTGAAATEGVATGAAALGIAEGATLGGIGLGFAQFAFILYEAARAGEVGEQHARTFGRHIGFALRLAGEVTGDYGYREALGRLRPGNYYEDYYDGWRDAETVLATSSAASKERLRSLGEKYGPLGIDPFMEVLLRRAGAYDFKPLPSSLDGLGL